MNRRAWFTPCADRSWYPASAARFDWVPAEATGVAVVIAGHTFQFSARVLRGEARDALLELVRDALPGYRAGKNPIIDRAITAAVDQAIEYMVVTPLILTGITATATSSIVLLIVHQELKRLGLYLEVAGRMGRFGDRLVRRGDAYRRFARLVRELREAPNRSRPRIISVQAAS